MDACQNWVNHSADIVSRASSEDLVAEQKAPDGQVHLRERRQDRDRRPCTDAPPVGHHRKADAIRARLGEPTRHPPEPSRRRAILGWVTLCVAVVAILALVFKYFGSRQPAINREWVDALAFTANSPSGLYLVPEPAENTATDRVAVPAQA